MRGLPCQRPHGRNRQRNGQFVIWTRRNDYSTIAQWIATNDDPNTTKTLPRETRPSAGSVPAQDLKSFGAIKALTDVDLELEPGEVLGLMGDNGAGKSTMVKIIAGNFPPTSGEIVLQDKPMHFHKPVEARQAGIEIVYQDLALCDNLTAASNIFLSREVALALRSAQIPQLREMNDRAASLSASSNRRPGRATSSAGCRADSARPSPLRGPACPRPRSC